MSEYKYHEHSHFFSKIANGVNGKNGMIAPNLVEMVDFNFKKDFVKKFRKKFLQMMNLEKHVLVGTNKEGLVNLNFHALQTQKKYLQLVFLKEQAPKHHTR